MAEETPKSGDHQAPKTTSEIFASAKVLAEAGQTGFGKDGSDFDKAKVAAAAEDILDAAKTYGKLNETSGVGQYVDKAEDYLHNYHSSDSAAAPAAAVHGGEKEEKPTTGGDDGGAKKGLGGLF
ncbi:hypothetical protein RND81_07G178900 [Saponaria officinalis]|uniref:Nodulin-related protein 1 n=1 Tax=Saponaria officinalis TaxID=3572 RepID=A0AAW1JPP0_SAPOF